MDHNTEVLNPDATIWQFFAVQDLIRTGQPDGSATSAEDLARHLSDPEGEPLTVAEVVEIARQAQDYDAHYRQ